ncbi:MAG: hypothetical protein GOMPHAMPRED_007109 [Gomphillus americanus]|uniref:Uncharacterized protein n=1 Tax=Gomphillus americanus TaxID=1940652 RepID=A0A8H3IYL9_9LECA|nr:MAG: hypothetical protein GOMPHAMPRED_007109 [Gomphillus americanus]
MSTTGPAPETSQTVKGKTKMCDHLIASIRSKLSKSGRPKEMNESGECDNQLPPSNPSVILTSCAKNPLNLVADYKNYLPIAEVIYEELDLPTVVNLFRTCKHLRGVLDNYTYHQQPRKWDINRQLRQLVHNPIAFRRMLAEAKAIMTGTFALEFFDPSNNNRLYLDIIQPDTRGLGIGTRMQDIVSWLQRYEGYEPVRCGRSLFYYENKKKIRITCLIRYMGLRERRPDTPMIRVIETREHVLEPVLKSAGSTHMLNVIGATTAYCFYANQTLLGKEMHLLNLRQIGGWYEPRLGTLRPDPPSHPDFMREIKDFLQFGWHFATTSQDKSPFEPWLEHGTRSPCDSWTFRVPLFTNGVIDERSSLPTIDDHIMTTSWNASQSLLHPSFLVHELIRNELSPNHPVSCAELDTNLVKHPCLRRATLCGLKKEPTYHPWACPANVNWRSWGDLLSRKLEETRQACLSFHAMRSRPLTIPWLGWDLHPSEIWYRDAELSSWFLEWKKYAREVQMKSLAKVAEPQGYPIAAKPRTSSLCFWRKGNAIEV